ncbi:MAG: transcription factor S [Candidatus Pacearchaeota archaeon]
MKFCPKCGAVLIKKGDLWVCPKGDYKSKEKIKIEVKESQEKEVLGIIKGEETSVYPITTAICPKCGNRKAYFFTAQTRAGDEAETRFFICTKCKYKWREYS